MIKIEKTMKPDEKALLIGVASIAVDQFGHRVEMPHDVANRLGIHPKRAYYLFLKWTWKRRWATYGVSARTCWLEEAGYEAAQAVAHEERLVRERDCS